MSLNIKPITDRVVIAPLAAETTTASGILMPDTAKEKPQKRSTYCIICNTLLSKPEYKYCKEHKRELGRKVERPSIEELSNLIKKHPLRQIAKKYKVVDNTIRKWLKFYNLPFKKKEIKEWYGLSGSNR